MEYVPITLSSQDTYEGSSTAAQETGTLLASYKQEFNNQFKTERDCAEEIYRRVEAAGALTCHYCGGSDLARNYGDRTVKCRNCKKRTWITAGTFLRRIRIPRAWLAAFWLMERGMIISSSKFHEFAGIAQSTALHIFKSITTAIQNHMPEEIALVPSTLFSPVFCRRSRETPRRAHPRVEQEESERESGILSFQSPSSAAQQTEATALLLTGNKEEGLSAVDELCGAEKEVYDVLSTTPQQVDILGQRTGMGAGELAATLTMLELAGVAQRLVGDMYVRKIPQESAAGGVPVEGHGKFGKETTRSVSTFIEFVRSIFSGISRKYLQNYLAAHWCQTSRGQWTWDSLLQACLPLAPVGCVQIRNYVSPLMVRMPDDGTAQAIGRDSSGNWQG